MTQLIKKIPLFFGGDEAVIANDPNLKAGRFGLGMLGISPEIQDQLNVIDPEL